LAHSRLLLRPRGLTHQSRTSAALNGAILALGAGIVALQFMWEPHELAKEGSMPGMLVTTGWALLAYGLLMSVVRAPRTIGLFLLALSVIAAWFINSIAFKAVVFAAGLLFASICWPWLQWLTALLTLAFLAAWGSGSLPLSPSVAPFDDTRTAVLAFAGVVAAATSLAIWQASRWSTELERWVRGLIKRWFGA